MLGWKVEKYTTDTLLPQVVTTELWIWVPNFWKGSLKAFPPLYPYILSHPTPQNGKSLIARKIHALDFSVGNPNTHEVPTEY
jgi:hypothetical protein